MSLNKFALSLLVFAMPAAAHAADIAPAPAYDWTGAYLGATLGYQWGEADYDIEQKGNWFPQDAGLVENSANGSVNPDGILGGVKAGYNYQTGSLVLGVEGDFSLVGGDDHRDGTVVLNNGIDGLDWSQDASMNWVSTIRARLGFAADRFLVYGTGGVAFADWDVQMKSVLDGTGMKYSDSSVRTGWTLGGGLEYAIADNWTINGEYLYMDFGEVSGTKTFPPPIISGVSLDHKVSLTSQVARVGVSYKF